MSVDQLPPRHVPRPPGDVKLVRYEEYIDNQIRSTRRTVKAVDVATALVLLTIGFLGFLLTVALVEHWLVPGGFNVVMRTLLFASLVGWMSYFAYRRLRPLCLRSINPVYAAHTIEQGSPTLKNSLINLLLFRQRRGEISEAVYHTLEEQAAQRLTRVPIDAAVDRTQLIHCGYVLLAVVAAAALYKVLSPKDPFVAAERVLMPWAQIVPASRVQISAIEPGATTLARGEFLDVSAEVHGIGENNPVLLRFTTADGRAVDKPIPMTLGDPGLRFTGRLPDAAEASGAAGVANNFTYRIEAGDARSLDYPVTVVAAPTILVERVEYDYPDYTGYLDHKVDGLGDIRAIEGTRVTIHARANSLIDEADVDFNADGRRDLAMTFDGDRARATFGLALREDRQTPEYLSYVLRFTNTQRRPNRNPVKHPIDVIPDYSPEVSILSPPEKTLDVRLSDTVVIEVEARDPDFALAKVQLHGEAAGRPTIGAPLLEKEHIGKFTSQYRFTPREHNLRAGDIVQYWVTADDIRTPKPNTAATERRIFRIMSPDPQEPPPDRVAQRDRRQQPGGQNDKMGQQQREGAQGEQGAGSEQDAQNGEQKPGDAGQQQGDQKQSQGGEAGQAGGQQQQDGEANDGQRGSQTSGDNSEQSRDANSQGGANQLKPQDRQNGSDGAQQQPGEHGSQQGQQSQQGQHKTGDQNQEGNKQTGAGAAGGESTSKGSQPDGARPDESGGSQSPNLKERGDSLSESTPVSPKGDDDGTAFERIRDHLQRRGELQGDESEATGSDRQQNQESATNGDQRQQGDKSADADGSTNENGSEQSATGGPPQPTPGDGKPTPGDEDKNASAQKEGQSKKLNGAQDGATPTHDRGDGAGADTRQDDVPQHHQQPSNTDEKTKSPGGQQTSPKGSSGVGEQPGENQGVPDSKENMKPSQKRQQSPSQESSADDKEPPAPGEGKRESDSQGEIGGDRPGGGEEGGGQKTNRDGTGSAGENQSADEGAGVSSERGPGNNSSNAGQDAEAGRETGKSGSEKPGEGSTRKEGQGNRPGGSAGEEKDNKGESYDSQEAGEQAGTNSSESSKSAGQQDGRSASANGQPKAEQQPTGGGTATGGGGETNTGVARPSAAGGTAPDGDAANLDYARQQTDLVLEKLADQLKSKRVDDGMLKELGWTEDELRTFVERWQRRKRAASKNDAATDAARRELDDALRSLGLRRAPLRQSQIQEDSQRDLREGYRGPVPLEYQERLRAYNQGISRARRDGE